MHLPLALTDTSRHNLAGTDLEETSKSNVVGMETTASLGNKNGAHCIVPVG